MSGKDVWLLAGTPTLIRYICEFMAQGLQEDKIMKLLMDEFPLERQEAKALFDASLRHLKIEELDPEQERGLSLARLRFLYRAFVEKKDFKGAHAVEQTRIGLLKLHEVIPTRSYSGPEERQKSIARQKALEQKGEEFYGSLQSLRNELQKVKKTAEEVVAKAAAEAAAGGGAGGGQADGGARKKDEGKAQGGSKGGGNSA